MSTQAPTSTAGRPSTSRDLPTSRTGSLREHRTVEEINEQLRGSERSSPPEEWREAEPEPEPEVLADMTRYQRQVYLSVEVHGIRPAELARETGAPTSTIRTLLEKARAAAEGRR